MEKDGEVFEGIEKLLLTMVMTPEDDRVLVYRKIDELFLVLEGRLRSCPSSQALEKLNELKFHIGMIARLDHPDGHSDDQHSMWARAAIGELRGYLRFVCAPNNGVDSPTT